MGNYKSVISQRISGNYKGAINTALSLSEEDKQMVLLDLAFIQFVYQNYDQSLTFF